MKASLKCSVFAIAAISAISISAQENIKWSGSAQYRVRANIDNDIRNGEANGTGVDLHHQYGWQLGMAAKANDEVSLHFKIENIGLNDFSRGVNNNNGLVNRSAIHEILLSEAYLRYQLSQFKIEAGIVPVPENSAYDAGYHVSKGSRYFDRSTGWNEIGSLAGINLQAKPSENLSLNLHLSTKGNTGKINSEHDDHVLDGYRIGFNAPFKAGEATITPAILLETGIYKTENNAPIPGEGNVALGTGVDVRVRPSSKVDLRAGVGYGMLEVEDEIDRNTVYLQLHPRFSLPGGRLVTAYSLGISNDDKADLTYTTHYVDINYTHAINSNLSIRPRFRTYIESHDDMDDARVRIRPELIFAARF